MSPTAVDPCWPAQVTAVFARRGYNVQSLAVGPSEAPGLSRITMVVPGGAQGTANIQRQLLKLIYVQKVRLTCSSSEKAQCVIQSLGESFSTNKHGSGCPLARTLHGPHPA